MAIVLDLVNDVETDYQDFVDALQESDGLRCCLDVDMVRITEYMPTIIKDIQLIPLEKFSCKRTIKGFNGTDIVIDSSFGLTNHDFISFEFKDVGLIEKDKYKSHGLLISSDNLYYEIIAELSKYFKFINQEDSGNSFILDESELSKLNLVPFKLEFHDNDFYVTNIENEMAPSEYDSIVDSMFCSDCAL